MKINQLFRKEVDRSLVDEVARCFGLEGMDDPSPFHKLQFVARDTVNRMMDLLPLLEDAYIPCKALMYVHHMERDPQKCITVFKQMLRLFERRLHTSERNVAGKKVIVYRIADAKTGVPLADTAGDKRMREKTSTHHKDHHNKDHKHPQHADQPHCVQCEQRPTILYFSGG